MTVHQALGSREAPATSRTALAPVARGDAETVGALTARTWAADASLGAGLVLFALGAEHLVDHVALAVVLIGWAAAETLWAVLALRGPVPLPRSALAVLLAGAAGWVVVQPASGLRIGAADAAVVVLQLAAALLLAAHVRGHGHARRAVPVGAVRQLLVMAVGALLATVVAVPGLAATNAGAHAVPHSEHTVSWWGGGHHHG